MGGLVIFLLSGAGATAVLLLRNISARMAMLAGCLFLLAGMAVTFGAIAAATAAGFAGTAVAGVGFGLAFLGAFRMITALAAPGDRAGLLAAIFIVAYLAFSIPALVAGIATTNYGLHPTALVYAGSLAVIAAVAVGMLLLRPGGEPSGPAGPPARRCRRARAPVRPARGRWTRRAPALPPRRPGNLGPRASAAGRGRGLTTGALLWQLNAIEAGCAEADDTDGGRRERVH